MILNLRMRSLDQHVDCNLTMVSLEWNVQGRLGRNEFMSKPVETDLIKKSMGRSLSSLRQNQFCSIRWVSDLYAKMFKGVKYVFGSYMWR